MPSANCIILIVIDIFVLARNPAILPASETMINLVKTATHGVNLVSGPALFVEVGTSSWTTNGSQRGRCPFHQGHGTAKFLPAVLSFGETAPGLRRRPLPPVGIPQAFVGEHDGVVVFISSQLTIFPDLP